MTRFQRQVKSTYNEIRKSPEHPFTKRSQTDRSAIQRVNVNVPLPSQIQRAIGNQATAHAGKIQRQSQGQIETKGVTLQKGDQGPNVTLIQQKLNAAPLTPLRLLAIDGKFGAQTEAHVKEFQRRQRLTVNGIVNPTTWAALQRVSAGATDRKEPQLEEKSATNPIEPPWLAIAKAEVGTKEIKGKEHNPRVLEYLQATRGKWSTDETPWCSGFVNWVMTQAGYTGTGSAAALSWLKWGKKVQAPAVGAIGVIPHGGGKGHVGFVIGKQGNNLLLLGGNQRNAVRISVYPQSKFSAFVFPTDYAILSTEKNLQESTQDYGKSLTSKDTR